jgi:hypothetical protein
VGTLGAATRFGQCVIWKSTDALGGGVTLG